ncbi:MAG: 1-deoxy-D-xylulose-5-phosphate reductoisomerase [Deltaproteobacteria bacterium]|nr:1-deoxy-D-xylulose-5-phosphate reductoisomerase [Deltaproteobacteria bacterium]
MKRLAILGSTGSIGRQALDLVARHTDRFAVEALVAGENLDLLSNQIRQFHPHLVSVRRESDARILRSAFGSGLRVLSGEEGAVEIAVESNADLVLSAIVGAAGLKPTYVALRKGRDVALANKESLVIAGELMTREAQKSGAKILPVDSEHSAIFQSLQAGRYEEVSRLILTASGGPFFTRSRDSMATVTVEEALKHPNWTMGSKITIDSATLMNKGLEVIEARWLFGFSVGQIDVQIHPQSIIHSMVEYKDGSVIAQMGMPDMRCAISYALAHPERIESGVERLDLSRIGSLTFFPPDLEKFPCLKLAFEAGRKGGAAPAVLNAANEIAVGRFLKGEIGFLKIAQLVETALEKQGDGDLRSLEELVQIDRSARELTETLQ